MAKTILRPCSVRDTFSLWNCPKFFPFLSRKNSRISSFGNLAKLPNDDIRLFLRDKNGKNFGQFQRLNVSLTEQGLNIVFATNGGMYHANRSPVGLYVENFTQYSPLITGNGPISGDQW